MASFDGKFDSERQDWPTPQDMFEALDKVYEFNFDLAAGKENSKCKHFYSQEQDALIQEWTASSCWLNPPYGGTGSNKLAAWIKKAHESSEKYGNRIVVLIPARTNTSWWHKHCMKAKEILFVEGRPKFGDAKHGLPQPLAIIIFENTDERVVSKTFSMKGLLVK